MIVIYLKHIQKSEKFLEGKILANAVTSHLKYSILQNRVRESFCQSCIWVKTPDVRVWEKFEVILSGGY